MGSGIGKLTKSSTGRGKNSESLPGGEATEFRNPVIDSAKDSESFQFQQSHVKKNLFGPEADRNEKSEMMTLHNFNALPRPIPSFEPRPSCGALSVTSVTSNDAIGMNKSVPASPELEKQFLLSASTRPFLDSSVSQKTTTCINDSNNSLASFRSGKNSSGGLQNGNHALLEPVAKRTFFAVDVLQDVMEVITIGSNEGWRALFKAVSSVGARTLGCNETGFQLFLLTSDGEELLNIPEVGSEVRVPAMEGKLFNCLMDLTPLNLRGQEVMDLGTISVLPPEESSQVQSVLCVPMKSAEGGLPVGALQLVRKKDDKFDSAFSTCDVQIVSAFADLVAMAVTNVLHTERDLRLVARSKAMADASRRLLSTVGVRSMFRVVTMELEQLLGFETARMFVYDESRGGLWYEVPSEEKRNSQDVIVSLGESSIIGQVFDWGESMLVRSPSINPFFNPELDQPEGVEVHNMAIVPIENPQNAAAPLGVLQVCNKRTEWVQMLDKPVVTEEDVEVLQTLALHVASALQCAFMLDQAHQVGRGANHLEVYGRVVYNPHGYEQAPESSAKSFDAPTVDPADLADSRESCKSMIAELRTEGPPTLPKRGSRMSESSHLLTSASKENVKTQLVQGSKSYCISDRKGSVGVANNIMDRINDSKSRAMHGMVDINFSKEALLNTLKMDETLPKMDLLDPNADFIPLSKDQLEVIVLAIFESFDIPQSFKIPYNQLTVFISVIREHYQENPFHNWHHAVTVLHTVFVCVLDIPDINTYLSQLDILALFIGALAHDMDHTGQNNSFHVQSFSPLSIQYNDKSVLEQHSAATLFATLTDPKHCILSNIHLQDFGTVRKIILSSILDTDLSSHQILMSRFNQHFDFPYCRDNLEDRKLLCSMLLHAADLSNPTREFRQAEDWATRLGDEMLNQAAMERSLGLPVAPFMEALKDKTEAAKNEIHFISTFARPLWESMSAMFEGLRPRVEAIDANLAVYMQLKSNGDGSASPVSRRHSNAPLGAIKPPFRQRANSNCPVPGIGMLAGFEAKNARKFSLDTDEILMKNNSGTPTSSRLGKESKGKDTQRNWKRNAVVWKET